MTTLRGKSLTATARDIADGYTIVNPLFLKPLDAQSLKGLFQQVMKVQTEIRSEKFPFGDVSRIRNRNMKLQRLHTALMIIKNFAKERRMQNLF